MTVITRLLTRDEVLELYSISDATLGRWRKRGMPIYRAKGSSIIRYDADAIAAWTAVNTSTPQTSPVLTAGEANLLFNSFTEAESMVKLREWLYSLGVTPAELMELADTVQSLEGTQPQQLRQLTAILKAMKGFKRRSVDLAIAARLSLEAENAAEDEQNLETEKSGTPFAQARTIRI